MIAKLYHWFIQHFCRPQIVWPHCPRCKKPMSDWFVWQGKRYCYPCGPLGENEALITEDQAIMKPRRSSIFD